MRFMILILVLTVFQAVYAEELLIEKERGYYQLDFDKTYTTYIHQDIELMVSLPPGYKYTATVPGSRDFVSVGPIQNTMYLSRPVPDDVMTNLTCHVLTPEGYEKKLLFKLIGKKNAPKVIAIQFTEPNTSELNRTIEEIKNRYNDQLTATLAEQEKMLNQRVHGESMTELRHFMIPKRRGKFTVAYKGASAFVDGMFNSRGNTYIKVRTRNRNDNCDIVTLTGVQTGGKKGSIMPINLINITDNSDGTSTYLYTVPEIPFRYIQKKDKYKKIKVRLHFTVWSKKVIRCAKIS